MNQALWIVAIVLAVSFAGSGLMKLVVPKDKLVGSGQGWAADYTPTNIRLIGVVELLGAAGLIVPAVTHIAPILVPLAAVGLPPAGQPTAVATLTVGIQECCGVGRVGEGPKLCSAVTVSCGSLQPASASVSAAIPTAGQILLRMVAPCRTRPIMRKAG